MKENFPSNSFDIQEVGSGDGRFEVRDPNGRWGLTVTFDPDGLKGEKFIDVYVMFGRIFNKGGSDIFKKIVRELFEHVKKNNLKGVISGVEEGLKKPNSGGKQLLLKL